MAGVTRCPGPAELAHALSALRVQVDAARVEQHAVALPDYPGGPRPSSVIRLVGGGFSGLGENVAFTPAEHEQFSAWAQSWFRAHAESAGKPLTVHAGSALAAAGALYARAALEAALIDLALRQAGLSLGDLTGVRARAVRFVASFAATPEPRAAMAALRASGFSGDFKLDVDPAWTLATLAELAREPCVAIVDCKGRGDARLAEQLATLLPRALLEDPPAQFAALSTGAGQSRVARDAPLNDASAVRAAAARGEAVNLKAPRMGGPLELLRGLDFALQQSTREPAAYLGGMFEVTVGRSQAQQIAALYCASAPNDLAPNVALERAHEPRTNSPASIALDQPGFGLRPAR